MTNHQDMTNPTCIPHDGGPCPVPPETRVRVWFRDGTVPPDHRAQNWDWSHHDIHADIVGYAILELNWAHWGPKLAEALERLIKAGATEILHEGRGFTAQYVAIETCARAVLRQMKGEEE